MSDWGYLFSNTGDGRPSPWLRAFFSAEEARDGLRNASNADEATFWRKTLEVLEHGPLYEPLSVQLANLPDRFPPLTWPKELREN